MSDKTMVKEIIRVSISRIKSWRRCHCQHYYKYVMRLVKRLPPKPLIRGKLLHELVEFHINQKDWRIKFKEHMKIYHKMFRVEQEEYGDLPEIIPRMMEGYIRKWPDKDLKYLKFKDDTGKTSRCEHKFEIDIGGGFVFVMVIDALPEDKKGRVWAMEHKTPKKIPSEEMRLTDLQTVIYCHYLPEINIYPEGVLWNYLRAKAPTVPELLKRGGLSKAKKIDTDYYTYMKAIKDNGLNPKDYKEILEDLKGREDSFYRRIYVPVSDELMKKVHKDFMDTCLEIKHLGRKSKTKNLSYDCNNCTYYSICQAELRGLDTDYIISSRYRKDDEEESEYEPEEADEA